MSKLRRLVGARVILAAAAVASSWAQPPLCSAADESPAPKKPRIAILELDKVTPDYAIQGEYRGQDSAGAEWGVQVVALGLGTFRAVAYRGGLPGDGADLTFNPLTAEGKTASNTNTGDKTTLTWNDGSTAEIQDGSLVWKSADGGARAKLPRVERKSPTLGLAPPEGATVLYAGPEKNEFQGNRPHKSGTLMSGARTKQSFGDCTLHLEFATPFMPNSSEQDRGNSGVYLQRRYEIQVLDSFGQPPADNGCGGMYGVRVPDVNMCLPPLQWQTYDIEFQGAKFDDAGKKLSPARVTVKLNGVVIHKDAEFPDHSGLGDKEGPNPGPIYLQYHLDPVQYRNIWLVERTK